MAQRKEVSPDAMEAALRLVHEYDAPELERRLAALGSLDETPIPIRLRSASDLKWAFERGIIGRDEARKMLGLEVRGGWFARVLGPHTPEERPH